MAVQFLEYIFKELKENRLSKEDAKLLMREFHYNSNHSSGNAKQLHPLVHHNTSTLQELQFTSTFSGEEPFFKDHIVAGRKVLSAVAYLELIRAATMLGTGNTSALEINKVTWLQPLFMDNTALNVHVALYEQGERVGFDIYTKNKTGEELLHSQGEVQPGNTPLPPPTDIAQLRARFGETHCEPAQFYDRCKQMGLDLGPSHRGLKEIWAGTAEVMTRISLPDGEENSGLYLHHGLMDSALQGALIMVEDRVEENTSVMILPFSLDRLLIFGDACTSGTYWAYVRFSPGSGPDMAMPQLDVDLYDEGGQVIIRFIGLGVRKYLRPGAIPDKDESLLFTPEWLPASSAPSLPEQNHRVIILCETPASLLTEVTALPNVHILTADMTDPIATRYQSYGKQLFTIMQQQLSTLPPEGLLLQLVTGGGDQQDMLSGMGGLLRTANREHPMLRDQLISVEGNPDPALLLQWLEEDAARPDRIIRYRNDTREVQQWNEISSPVAAPVPWKADGVYLITGGYGGLGRLFASDILQHAPTATIILTGRRQLDEATISSLEPMTYYSCDVKDEKNVQALFEMIRTEYGQLNGIVHAAGVVKDGYILKKDPAQIDQILDSKTTGLVHIDEASADFDLDFFVFFSSVAGAAGNTGQGEYGMANSFMDYYACYRDQLVQAGKRKGHTLSVNWPLWISSGMQASEAFRHMMKQTVGVTPLPSATGVTMLHHLLALPLTRIMVLHGIGPKLHQLVDQLNTSVPLRQVATGGPVDEALSAKVMQHMIQLISHHLSIPADMLDPDAQLEEFGFDSIQLTQFATELNTHTGILLTPALFFEYPSIRLFTGYLCTTYPDIILSRLEMTQQQQATDGIATEKRNRGRKVIAAAPAPSTTSAVAIIGISGRFPQSKDLDAFWANLVSERDCITEAPADRWDAKSGNAQQYGMRWGGFMEDIAAFDPLFFNISPREAFHMDPHQRLLMEYVWKAIEDAGYNAESLAGTNTCMFIGTSCGEYAQLLFQRGVEIEAFSGPAIVSSIGPNRMSYFLDIHGPSQPIETACSSSLIAIHRAAEHIRHGYSETAIAGGINTLITSTLYHSFSKAGMLSANGRCKSFGAGANGYVRGEGVGMLLLKRLDAAERDGDHIYGVIRGSGENHGGKTSSLTAPSPNAQAALLQSVYEQAGVPVSTVSYIEGHGTGTRLGDPTEVDALKSAFTKLAAAEPYNVANPHGCGLGSVKSNIGHLEMAAGVAGVMKVLLQLQHRTLVRTLHCDEPNPRVDLQGTPFYLVQQTRPWEAITDDNGHALPRRAGVSSFGFGGTNAHVILEEYIPAVVTTPESDRPALIVLSARTEDRLKEMAARLHHALTTQHQHTSLHAVAYTLQAGRMAMKERFGFVARNREELLQGLAVYAGLNSESNNMHFFLGQVISHDGAAPVLAKEDVLGWIAENNYETILERWVQGYPVDWELLYESKPRRIPLPTYPFARDRYWPDNIPATPGIPGIVKPTAGFDEFLYDELIDQVIKGDTTIDNAITKINPRNKQ